MPSASVDSTTRSDLSYLLSFLRSCDVPGASVTLVSLPRSSYSCVVSRPLESVSFFRRPFSSYSATTLRPGSSASGTGVVPLAGGVYFLSWSVRSVTLPFLS